MPFSGATRDNTLKLLNITYAKRLRSLVAHHDFLYQWFAKRTEQRTQGEKYGITLRLGLGASGVTGSALVLGPPGVPDHEKAYFTLGGHTDQMALDVALFEDSASPAAASKPAMSEQMEALAKRFQMDMDTIWWGDGTNKLGQLESATDTTHIVVTNLQYFRKGQRVDILLNATGAVGAGGTGFTIQLNRLTRTLTLLGGSGPMIVGDLNSAAATYGIYRANSYPTAANKPIFGLLAALSENNPPTPAGLYGDIDRTSDANEPWRGNELRNPNDGVGGTPRPFSMRLINDALDLIRERGTGLHDTKAILVNDKQWAYIVNELAPDRRYNGTQTTLMGWAEAIQFPGIPPIVRVSHCPGGKAFILTKEDITIAHSHEAKWDDKNGLLKDSPGHIGYYARFFYRPQLEVGAPCDHCIIHDLMDLPAAA